MPFNIYLDLQGQLTTKDIVKNWKNIGKPEKNKSIIELVINMAGYNHELTTNEINQAETAKNYQEVVKTVVESDFHCASCITNHPQKSKLVSRFDLFAQTLVSTFDNTSAGDWLNSLLEFTNELIKNTHKRPDLVMVATFFRIVFVKHLTDLRARCEREKEYMSTHTATMKVLSNFIKLLFASFAIGVQFKDFHEMYVNYGLSLYHTYPEFFILDWNKLEDFKALLVTNNIKTITKSYETLRELMEGNDTMDTEVQEDIRLEISEYFESNMDSLFIDMILCDRVNVSKEALQLLIVVQKYHGPNAIVKDKKNLEDIYDLFMHKNKVIRPFAMEYMQLTMTPDTTLDFILTRFEKYDVPITDIVASTFDRKVFGHWETYGLFLEKVRSVRSVTVTVEVIKQVLVQLSAEYREDAKKNPETTEMPDSKIDILEFIGFYPRLLYYYRVTNPVLTRYVKMLGIINAVNFEDFSNDVPRAVIKKMKQELLDGLETFETFIAVQEIMVTLLKLRQLFKEIQDEVLDLLVYHSSMFAAGDISTPEDMVHFKRATYIVYTNIVNEKTDVIPNESYETLYLENLHAMLEDDFLDNVPVKGAVLSVWAQVLARCFKIVINRINEKKVLGPMNLESLETSMKSVLEKMRKIMTETVESKTVQLFSDMRLIIVNAGNMLHYLRLIKKNTEPETSKITFTCLVKLTEMMMTHTKFLDIIHVFVAVFDAHHDIIENREEISVILQHFGQPHVHKHNQLMIRLLTVLYSKDTSEDKNVFRKTIVHTLISIKNNSKSHAEANISLFWLSFREFTTSSLKLKSKDFLSFVANLSFEILQHQLQIPQTPDHSVNRFQIFQMIPLIVEDMRKSVAVTTSAKEVFSTIQQKHEKDFSPDENQTIKEFLKELSNKKRHHESQTEETSDD